MEEISSHIIYELLEGQYSRLAPDYVLLSVDAYNGVETHKNAVVKAFEIISRRYDEDYEVLVDKMEATRSDIEELLKLPNDDYYNKRAKSERGYNIPGLIPYWYAFLEPPYSVNYLTRDFKEFNEILFPNKLEVEVYRWNDDFSSYFDDGKEWWGTGLWSVYDKATNTLVIIAASVTD